MYRAWVLALSWCGLLEGLLRLVMTPFYLSADEKNTGVLQLSGPAISLPWPAGVKAPQG